MNDDDLAPLHARLVAAAQRDGILDVAYRTVDSPVGPLLVAATDVGLVRVAFTVEGHDDVLQQLADRISPRILSAPGRLDAVAHELDEYFAGARTEFRRRTGLAAVGRLPQHRAEAPARDRLRAHRELRGRRAAGWATPRRCCRQRLRHQPAARRRAVPPGGAQRRRHGRRLSASR